MTTNEIITLVILNILPWIVVAIIVFPDEAGRRNWRR